MTHRQAVEQVLRKHGVSWTRVAGETTTQLLDDLLATLTPERKGLEKILEHHQRQCPMTCDIAEQLMAWASGETRTWCEHIKMGCDAECRPPTRWTMYFPSKERSPTEHPCSWYVPTDWTVCPICAAPRPTT